MAIDYKPFENQELTAFSPELLNDFLTSHSGEGASSATDHTFQKLKKQDDDIRKQIQELIKKREQMKEMAALEDGEEVKGEAGSPNKRSPMKGPRTAREGADKS